MPNSVVTAGDLRQLLVNTLEGVLAGEIKATEATAIVKLAGQINASLLAEVEIAKHQMQNALHTHSLGRLPVGVPLNEVPLGAVNDQKQIPDEKGRSAA